MVIVASSINPSHSRMTAGINPAKLRVRVEVCSGQRNNTKDRQHNGEGVKR